MLHVVPVRLELVIECCLLRHIECVLVLHCDIVWQVVTINLFHASPARRALATIDQQSERACYDRWTWIWFFLGWSWRGPEIRAHGVNIVVLLVESHRARPLL